jgi:hypothetical protein
MTIRTLHLASGEVIGFDRLRGSRLECRGGTLWITVDGQTRDVVLEAGDDFECESSAPVVVHALGGPAVMTLKEHPVAPTSAWKRAWAAIAPRSWQGAW